MQPQSAGRPARHMVAVVVGSLRTGSLNRKVARAICALAPDRLDCTLVEIRDLPLYDEDRDRAPPPSYVTFRREVAAADGVLFCTPEYNRGVSGGLKNAIDVGSRPYGRSVWDGKPAAIVSASQGSIGGFGANHQLRQSCVFLNMPVMQQPEAYLSGLTDEAFDSSGRPVAGGLADFLARFTLAFAAWLDVLAPHRPAEAGAPQAAVAPEPIAAD